MLETSFSRAYEALSHDRNAPVSGMNHTDTWCITPYNTLVHALTAMPDEGTRTASLSKLTDSDLITTSYAIFQLFASSDSDSAPLTTLYKATLTEYSHRHHLNATESKAVSKALFNLMENAYLTATA